MSKLKKFNSPSLQAEKDLSDQDLKKFDELWSNYINACTENSIVGDPWSSNNDENRTWYYNPLKLENNPETITEGVMWGGFPNRINMFFKNVFKEKFNIYFGYNPEKSQIDNEVRYKLYELADKGPIDFIIMYPKTTSLFDIYNNPCNPKNKEKKFYDPYGPRGWQDEYCEWAVRRNDEFEIVQIDFTHENPNYWYFLWEINPDIVCSLYKKIVNNDNVQLDDLCIKDNGVLVMDLTTGRPIYNPINKWNSGTQANDSKGGAVHLTSPPNTLDAEIFLGAAATIQRKDSKNQPILDMNDLICASLYGRKDRNSDPRIGWVVNQIVRENNAKVTLADPVGLYGQIPDFSAFELPSWANKKIEDCFQIIRGEEVLKGYEKLKNMILHTRFILPDDANFKFSDIKVNNLPLKWGSQIAETIKVQLSANAIIIPKAVAIPELFYPVKDKENELKQIKSLMPLNVYKGYVANKTNIESSIKCTPLFIEKGGIAKDIVVVCDSIGLDTEFEITQKGNNITSKKEGEGVQISSQYLYEINRKMCLVINILINKDIPTGPVEIKIKSECDHPYTQYGLLEII